MNVRVWCRLIFRNTLSIDLQLIVGTCDMKGKGRQMESQSNRVALRSQNDDNGFNIDCFWLNTNSDMITSQLKGKWIYVLLMLLFDVDRIVNAEWMMNMVNVYWISLYIHEALQCNYGRLSIANKFNFLLLTLSFTTTTNHLYIDTTTIVVNRRRKTKPQICLNRQFLFPPGYNQK